MLSVWTENAALIHTEGCGGRAFRRKSAENPQKTRENIFRRYLTSGEYLLYNAASPADHFDPAVISFFLIGE